MKKIIALALALVLTLSLAACGGSSTGSAPAGNSTVKQNVTGRYEIESISWDDGTSSSGETLQSTLDMMGGETFLELYSDNTALLCLLGQRADMGFSETQMWRADNSLHTYDFSVKNGKATLYAEGTTYVFVKN
jgi:hypothetical protein